METQISSRMTGVLRLLLVPWLVIASLGAIVLATVSGQPLVALMALPVAVLWWFLIRPLWSCQLVVMTGTELIVGAERRRIPFTDVAEVSENRFTSPEQISVRLHDGERIRFLAKMRPRFGFSIHPIVGELTRLSQQRATQSRRGRAYGAS